MNLLNQYNHLTATHHDSLGRWWGTPEQPFLYPGVTSVIETIFPYTGPAVTEERRKEAADNGTRLHELFNALAQDIPDNAVIVHHPEKEGKFSNVFKVFLGSKQVKYVASEVTVVSDKYGYAGHIDLLAEVKGKMTLIDYKTGFQYSNNWGLQIGAYHLALCEQLKINPKEMGLGIFHIPYKNPSNWKYLPFTHHEWFHTGFLACLELYKHQPRFTELKKMKWPYLLKPCIQEVK